MSKSERTIDQKKWIKQKGFFESHQFHKCAGFKNMAVTKAGELGIGMTHNMTWGYYSASYMERDGKRINEPRQWDLNGISLDGGSDLHMSTIQAGIRTV